MLSFLVSWAEQLIIALIIIVMIEMIIPNSSYRKYIKLVLGIFIIYTIFSPLVNNKMNKIEFGEMFAKEFKTANITYNETAAINYEQQIEETYKEKFKEALSENLKEKGYELKNMNLDVTYEKEEIQIKKLELKISRLKKSDVITIEKVKITDESGISDKDIEKVKEEISNTYNIDSSKILIESEKKND